MFWTTNDKDMFVYLEESDEQMQLDFVKHAICVAFDWLGQRLYWSVLRNGDVSWFLFLSLKKFFFFQNNIAKIEKRFVFCFGIYALTFVAKAAVGNNLTDLLYDITN